jgi:predicted TPR repeat methyltransferase
MMADLVTPIEAVQAALALHREGRLAEARLLYERVLAVEPDHPEALHFLGLLRHQLGARSEGIAWLRRAVAAEPAYAAAHSNLGNMLLEAGDLDGAEQAYRQALAYDPGLAETKNNLALLLRRRGRPEAAEAIYREAIALAPENPLAYCNLGQVLFEMGRLDEATEMLGEAVRLNPEFAEAFHNLGHILSVRDRPQAAAEAYRRAVELGADAYLGLATALREQGLVDEAIAAYRHVIGIGGKPATAFYNLGMLLSAQGRDGEAAEVYRQWLEEEPGNPVARHMLAASQGDAVPSRASDDYVQAIFDGFAPRFDQRLAELDYRAPELVTELVRRLSGPAARRRVLDAGCGTGLCGPLLRERAERLTGVDLSGPMLDQAAARGCYDALVQAELTDYLASSPACYDLVASADTLVYFGDLRPVIAAAAQAMAPGGYLVATLEKDDGGLADGYRLRGHGRYSHTEKYLRRVIADCGLELVALESVVLRQEMAQPVIGMLFAAAWVKRDA